MRIIFRNETVSGFINRIISEAICGSYINSKV